MEKFPGEGGDRLDEKKETLSRAMYNAQPTFDDFRNCPGYSKLTLRDDRIYLDKKNKKNYDNERVSSDDEFAYYMEPIVAYALNTETLLPTRENFSFLASDYDDKINGTDVVFGVKNKKTNEPTIFSVDVATDTAPLFIQKKFRRSLDEHDGSANIKYCMYKDKKWSEPKAPHFILGMSPASQNKAMDKIIITNGELKGRENDFDSDFILLSEIREQINMHLAILKNRPKTDSSEQMIAKLGDLVPAIRMGLYRTLGINNTDYPSKEEREQVFEKKYFQKKEQFSRFDNVYGNIISVARQRTLGAKSLKAS